MTEKRLDYDLLWNNYYQVIELDDEDTDYLRRLSPTEIIKMLNEQQATISALTKENKELGKNFDDLVEWASKIANRNVVLDEQIGQLQRENEQLRLELKEKEEDEQLYANEIVKLNKEAKEVLNFKSLGGDY